MIPSMLRHQSLDCNKWRLNHGCQSHSVLEKKMIGSPGSQPSIQRVMALKRSTSWDDGRGKLVV
jgi:hypothetical protein